MPTSDSDDLDDLYEDTAVLSTPAVADFAGISPSAARALAADLGVGRAGQAFAWTKDDVENLLDQLGEDDSDPEDEGDEGTPGEDDDEDDDLDEDEDDDDAGDE